MSYTNTLDSNPARAEHLSRKWDQSSVSFRPLEEMSSRERWAQSLAEDWDYQSYERKYGSVARSIMDRTREAARSNELKLLCSLASDLSACLRDSKPKLFAR